VTNREAGEELVSAARRLFDRDVQNAWRDQDYNMVMRRAQEVVELALKGALRLLGVDYPREHDVGLLFVQQAKAKIPAVDQAALQQIGLISRRLVQARGPSFYLERRYGEVEARQALDDACFVLEAVERMMRS